MPPIPTLTLNNGHTIPHIGFGVFQVPPDQVIEPVETALEAGYRLIDTAAAYRNEDGVGKALANSGIDRDELFITTKLWNADHGFDNALRAFDASLSKLGLDVVDLYLIHWPTPARGDIVETWKALEKIYAEGRARSIGVSNFTIHHLNRLRSEATIVPAVNQIELHPRFPQDELRAYHQEHQIATEAWSPIGQGQGLLDDPTVKSVAEAHGKSPAQAVLRWHLQLGNSGHVVIPKSVTPQRIRENLEVFDFELDDGEMAMLSSLSSHDKGGRIGPDPDHFNAT
ncbi:MAG TPA: aldo/keto reductase [Frankiaceae bacterium]|jgi:diketogulonate reductase-like aldo/keto reductase|nr:aldo/keto reductase [Frankiaceae bacterium]